MCVSPSVVCDRLITNRLGSGDPDLQGLARERWRGTGPRPTVKGGERFFPVARGPVPRERWSARTMARDRPSPYGEGWRFFIVARGPVPREFPRHDVCSPSVVCDRLITNGSGSGDLDLQGLARE